MKTTSEWIEFAVQRLGITTYRLSKLMDANASTVVAYKNGRAVMSENHAIKLGELLGIDPMPIVAAAAFERSKQDHIKAFWAKHAETLVAAFAATVLWGLILLAPTPVHARETGAHNPTIYTLWEIYRRFKRAMGERRSRQRSQRTPGFGPVFFELNGVPSSP